MRLCSYKSGSLQDLVDSDEQLDVDYLSSGQYKRHQQSSRNAKYSSSVSSRNREGGSLPINVNHPVSFDSQFYNNRIHTTNSKKSKDSHDNERNATTHHIRNALTGDSITHNRDDIAQSNATTSSITSVSSTNDKPHTIIDIEDPDDKSHILAHDSLAQVCVCVCDAFHVANKGASFIKIQFNDVIPGFFWSLLIFRV